MLAKRTRWVLGVALLLALLVGGCSPALSSAYTAPSSVGAALADAIVQREAARAGLTRRLARQSSAVRPEFEGDLQALADAPYYRIQATLDAGLTQLTGRLELRYTNTTGGPLSELVFRLYPNAATVYGGGSLTVASAGREGAPTAFAPNADDPTILRLPLQPALNPGERTEVVLNFTATVPTDVIAGSAGYGIFNRSSGVTTLASWYPVLAPYEGGWLTPEVPAVGDAMLSDTALFKVSLTVPAGLTVVATGTTTQVEAAAGTETWEMVSGPAREFALAISDRFIRHTTDVGGVQVSFYALPSGTANTTPETALEIAAAALRSYSARFGPYPFSEFDVVDAVVPIGGYEFSGMVFVDYGLRTREEASRYRYMLAHEVAHQWWYGLVGNRATDDPWLDEALASYSALVYLADGVNGATAEGLRRAWAQIYGARDNASPPVDGSVYLFGNWQTYTTIVYYQGALFLADVREALGDDAFFALLQTYVATYKYRFARTADFMALLQSALGDRFAPLVRDWFGEPDPAWLVSVTPSPSGEESRRQVVE